MKRYLFVLILLAGKISPSLYGQTLPETNNRTRYDDLTARKKIFLLYYKLKAGYAFDKLAKACSQDYGSYEVGGTLGWQKPNQFVPIFNNVINRMTKDQLSKPFKSELGYHIVQLLDRKEGEVLARHILLKVNN